MTIQPFPLAREAVESTNQPQGPQGKRKAPDLAVRLICPECRQESPNIEEEFSSGDLVCRDCGLVLGDRVVDTRSEWRTFANEEGDDPSRVGGPQNPWDEDTLATSISFRDGNTGMSKDLQRANARATNEKSNRSIANVAAVIQDHCDRYHMPRTVSDTAKQLYKRCDEEKLLKGKPVDAIVAACIFIACRQAAVPRTFREICDLTNVPKKLIGQCYKTLERAFNLAPGAHSQNNKAGFAAHTSPEDLMVRYGNFLDLPQLVQTNCSAIAAKARELDIAVGRSPVSIAGGTIYFVNLLFDCGKSLRDIAQVANVSEGTIKIVCRLLFAKRHELVPKEWIAAGQASWTRLDQAHVSAGGNSGSSH